MPSLCSTMTCVAALHILLLFRTVFVNFRVEGFFQRQFECCFNGVFLTVSFSDCHCRLYNSHANTSLTLLCCSISISSAEFSQRSFLFVQFVVCLVPLLCCRGSECASVGEGSFRG